MTVGLYYRYIGEAYVNLDQHDEGLRYLKLFREISKSEENCIEIQRGLAAIGWCYLEHGRFLERQWAEEDKNDHSKRAKYQICYVKAEKFSRHAYAAIPKDEGKENFSDREGKEMKIAALLNRGTALLQMKKLDSAQTCFLEASGFAKNYTSLYDKYHVNLMLLRVTILIIKQEYADALKLNKEIMHTLEKLPIADSDKQSSHAEALNQKIQVLVGLRQFQQAKKISKSIFVRNGGKADGNERTLKTLISICRLLKDVNKSELDDSSTIKIYEKIGDLCVNLECFDTANFYYEKAMDKSISGGIEDKKVLGGLYFSIAENYTDLENFQNAEIFYNKKLELCNDDAREACKIYLHLAKSAHLSGKSIDEIMNNCDNAKKLAIRSGRPALEARVLQLIFNYQSIHGSATCDISEQEFIRFVEQYQLDTKNLFTEENDQEESVSESSEELNVDELSEEDDEDSDSELQCIGGGLVKSGRKRVAYKHKFNAMGESELHVKCQEDGNMTAIQTMIKMGHDKDIADRAKFAPIHEACNYGFLEYVRELHTSGAKLNLKSNTGVTPLITACSNGSVDIIEYLVQAGALVHIQEECGWTAKDHLTHYINSNRSTLSSEVLERFSIVIRKMDKGMRGYELLPKKPVSTVFETEGDQNDTFLQDDILSINDNENKPSRLSRNRKKPTTNRYRTDFEKTIQSPCSQDSPNLGTSSSIKSYVDAVSSVRNRRLIQPRLNLVTIDRNNYLSQVSCKRTSTTSRQSIIEDDWLEDDVSRFNKKSRKDLKSKESIDDDLFRDTLPKPKNRNINKFITASDNSIVTVPKYNPSELYPRTSTQIPTETSEYINANIPQSGMLQLTQNPPIAINENRVEVPASSPSVLRFYVQIEGRRLLIPIPKDGKVSDLSKEVLNRYNSSKVAQDAVGRMPIIKLLDSEGCELDDGDMLLDLFGSTASEPIRLQSRVEKWELKNVEAVYEKLCNDMNLMCLPEIKQALSQSQQTTRLDIERSIIRSKSSQPIFRALRYRSVLTEVNLAGNKLGIGVKESTSREDSSLNCMEELGNSLKTLSSLVKLNLSSNALLQQHLEMFTKAFCSQASENIEMENSELNVRELNLGFNFVGDESDTSIMTLFGVCPKLQTLRLTSCGLSKRFFLRKYNEWENLFSKLNGSSIINIDISHNPNMEVIGIDKMLQLLNPNKVLSIDISKCTLSNDSKGNLGDAIFKYASRGRPDIALQDLNMSKNSSVELEDFCNSLYHMSCLKILNASYCDGLNLEFVVRLFEEMWTQSSNCEKVQLNSDLNLWIDASAGDNLTERLLSNIEHLASENCLNSLQLSYHGSDKETNNLDKLIAAWQEVFKDKSKVDICGTNLRFSVTEPNTYSV